MRKQKVLTPEQQEEIRTKGFFDMILPSTVKFMSDHYIVGDSYRCVWVVREIVVFCPLLTQNVPLCNSTICFTNARPIPFPSEAWDSST